MIITVWLFGNYTSFNFCFPEKPFLLCYDLQQLDKIYLCKQKWHVYLFLSTWFFQNLASPAGSPVDLMVYYNWITTSYTNHCFNLFPNCLWFMSPCCTMTLSILLVELLISYVFYKIVVSYSTYLEEIDNIYNST